MTSPITALVTGAGRGIGAAISRALAEQGFSVAVLDIDLDAVTKIQKSLESEGKSALAIACDVSERASVDAALAQIKSGLGPISVLVNNVGVGGPFHRTDEVTDEEWDWLMATNLRSVFFFSRAVLPEMKNAGFGRIVNIASIQGLLGAARSSTYVASKHAVLGYTKAIAAEWGEFGITCNAICPGYIATRQGIQEGPVADHLAKVISRSPVKRVGTPEEVAALTCHLVGPHSGYLNGTAITLDGGISCHVGID